MNKENSLLPHLDDYLLNLQTSNYSPETLYNYERDLKTFEDFLNDIETEFDDIEKKTILNYKAYLVSRDRKTAKAQLGKQRLASFSVNRMLSALRSYFKFLIDMDYKSPIDPSAIKLIKKKTNFINKHNLLKFNMGANVCIIGLGYVGLPLACLCTRKGHNVIGIDINSEVVNKTNNGFSHIKDKFLENELHDLKGKLKATTDGSGDIKKADIVIICVPTPIDDKFHPNLGYIESASELISKNIQKSQLIILESTVHPGTTEEIVNPILEQSGLKAGIDFFLAHCPERIDPGNKQWNVSNIPRVIGAFSKQGAEKAEEFYSSIIDAEITILKAPKEAEATKVMENSFRDVNIAFMNEMAKSFDKAGIDIMEVIKGASTKPFAFLAHYPGCGVGGHCIPVDPYYLIEKAKQLGFEHRFLGLARKINEGMPKYTTHLLSEGLNHLGKSVNGSKIGIYGIAYKKDLDDARESPSVHIIKLLKEKGAELFIYDPFVKKQNNVNSFDEFLEKSDYIVLATDHSEFKNVDLNKLKQNNIQLIVDGRNCLDKDKLRELGIAHKGIGY